jgi:TRAP-type C4-dicarboxylate transport system permease small subunit
MILADMIGRSTSLFTVPAKIDITQYLLYLATFLAAPWALRDGAHVAIDLVVSMLRPRAADIVSRLAALLGAVISAAILYYSLVALEQSRTAGTLIFKQIVFPEWYTLIPVPITFALTFLIFLDAAIRGAPDGRKRNLNTGA